MVKKNLLTGADYLLLLFYVKGKTPNILEPIEGRTRITKMMFLFQMEWLKKIEFKKNLDIDQLQFFEAYNYGPFSSDVHDELDLFISIGFLREQVKKVKRNALPDYDYVQKVDTDNSEGYDEWIDLESSYEISTYTLTNLGKKYVEEELLPQLGFEKEFILSELSKLKEQMNSNSLNDILSYVYNKYPDFAEKSKIREQVLKNGDSKLQSKNF
ncbi:hypothetical protein [Enterococcus avium]|uniref:hypothetical protein n=1 Tax=Enterococcus avium TaxID=33945 RepID=UPI00288CEC4C|nr:hypothetical protein [Enterococcus avium]MDT2567170.1 hypothetical protein [Enterococcus avium]